MYPLPSTLPPTLLYSKDVDALLVLGQHGPRNRPHVAQGRHPEQDTRSVSPPLLLFPHQADPPDALPTHVPSGKVAARIAVVLMGKHKPVFDRGSASSFVLSVSLSGLLLRAFA